MRYWKDWRRHGIAAIAALLLFSPALRAQSDEIQDVSGAANLKAQPAGRALPAFPSDAAGEGTISLEGFYLTGSAQAATNASGLAVNVKEYLPGIGVLDAAVDGSVGNGLHTGTMFVALEQTPFLGWHWDLVAGDSQVSSNLLGDSASNISTPDISTRGFRVAVKRTNRTYQFFFGPRHPARRPARFLPLDTAAI